MIPVKTAAKAGMTVHQIKKSKENRDLKNKNKALEQEKKDFREMNREGMKSKSAAEQFKRDMVKDVKSSPRNNPYNDIKEQVKEHEEKSKNVKKESSFQKAVKGKESSIQQTADKNGMHVGKDASMENGLEK